MKTKILSTFILIACLFIINLKSNAQTVPFVNNLNCTVVIGFELRDASCNVCDWGQITLQPNSTYVYTVSSTCGPLIPFSSPGASDACIWVVSINGAAVATNHMSHLTCCTIPVLLNGSDPSGCSSSGNYQVLNFYPNNWTINP